MKKIVIETNMDDLKSEYAFDYSVARPNRFANPIPTSDVLIRLDSDVAQVFTSAETVNAILRALIQNMPIATPSQD